MEEKDHHVITSKKKNAACVSFAGDGLQYRSTDRVSLQALCNQSL